MTAKHNPNAPLQHLLLNKGYQNFLKVLSEKQRKELAQKIADEHNQSIDDLLCD